MRVAGDVARRLRDGHPWVHLEALRGRQLTLSRGKTVDVLDEDNQFIGRALCDPQGSPPLRIFSTQQGERLDEEYLRRCISRCRRQRERMLDLSPTACYRVLSPDSEGIPAVAVDCYGSYLLASLFSPAVEAFEPALVRGLAGVLRPAGIYAQRRYLPPDPGKPRPPAELLWGDPLQGELVVTEGRCRFVVDVTAPTGTGLYPDMRLGRETVARLAGGRRVLNCFSYTGGFSVVAALAGATVVVSVDSAARSHSRARRNFGENGLDLASPAFEFVTGDAFAVLARMSERRRRFDLVILDPPTFSSSKGQTFTALRDYADLVAAALQVTAPEGLVCVASNASRLHAGDLERAVGRGASMANRPVVITHRLGLPPDYPTLPGFPEATYLKFFVAQTL